MTLFDLLFILLFLTALGALLTAGWLALRRQGTRARRIVTRVAAGAAAYMAVVVLVSWFAPRRVLSTGTPQCFDDWCVTVAGFREVPQSNGVIYDVAFRLTSRARRVSQRENNLSVYLTDDRGKRYDQLARSTDTPLNVILQPGESVTVERAFLLPSGAQGPNVVITHEGGFPIRWFIVGYDSWFRKPSVVKLQ